MQEGGRSDTVTIRTTDTLSGSGTAAERPRRLSRWLRGQIVQRRIVAGLFILALLGLSYAQWPRAAETLVYDLSTRLIPAEPDLSGVAFIDTGPEPVDYDDLARAVDALSERGIAHLGIYLPLHRRQSPPDMRTLTLESRRGVRGAPAPAWLARLDRDARLADALRRHGGVVLPAFPADAEGPLPGDVATPLSPGFEAWYAHRSLAAVVRPPGAGGRSLQAPLPELGRTARAVGAALPPVSLRGIPLALNDRDGPRAGFLLPMLTGPGLPVSDILLESGRGARIGADLLPLGPHLSAHPPPPRRDPRDSGLPFRDLQSLLSEGSADLEAHAVIIGRGDPGARAVNAGAGLLLPEAVWQAYALASVLDGGSIRVPAWSHGLERGLLLLAGLYLFLLPLHLAGRTAGLLLTALIAVLALNAALLLLLVRQLWLPVTLPILALLAGHGLLWLWLRYSEALARDRRDASDAHHRLGSLLRAQGQLEPAFDHLSRVREVSPPLCAELYQLGHDLVRRRQYARAMDVYAHLNLLSPRYRDVPVRIERLRGLSAPHRRGLVPDLSKVDSALIVDGETLEKPALGRYQIECQLGRGSMGIVYLGVDPKIGRKVAIKTLALNQEFEPEMLEQVKWRFFREAEASGRLNHRNIVTIYDVGEEHDLAFIAMDYLEGTSLDAFARSETLLPVGEVLEICAQVAEGLAYAHDRQVIHRDVKPANVIYDRSKGKVSITDFGIACLTDNNRTRTGTILGTPAFMSPEQVSGHTVDGRSDLFSLGVTLYQLLSGQLPFTADTMAGLVYQITQTRHQSISEIRPELGPLVALIMNRALEKEPDRRYQSGTELARALRECAAALKRGPRPGQYSAHQALTP